MKKKIIIVIVWTLVLAIWTLLIYYINSEKFKNFDLWWITYFIRNNSWQSPFLDNVPYQKWDELELNLVLKNKWTNEIKLDLEKLKSKIKIKKIYINDREVNENDNLTVSDWEKIKIIWEALDNWILKKDDENINVEIVDTIQKEEEIKEETQTWVINITSKEVFLEKTSLNSNINNLIELSWSWKDFVEYVNIWWISLKPIKNLWKVYLSIDKNTFTSWEYFVIIQFINWDIENLEQKIIFTYSNQKVNIANITPNEIQNDLDRYIVIQWNGFSKVVSIQLNNNIILKTTSFNIISDNVLWIKIPKWLEPWRYYINIMTTDWIYEIRYIYFNITN